MKNHLLKRGQASRMRKAIAVLLLGQAAAQLIGTSCPGLSVNTGLNQEKGVIVDGRTDNFWNGNANKPLAGADVRETWCLQTVCVWGGGPLPAAGTPPQSCVCIPCGRARPFPFIVSRPSIASTRTTHTRAHCLTAHIRHTHCPTFPPLASPHRRSTASSMSLRRAPSRSRSSRSTSTSLPRTATPPCHPVSCQS